METAFLFLVQWCGVILSGIFGLLVIISTISGGLTREEKQLAKDDDPGHYLMTNSFGGFAAGLLIVLIGAGACYFIGWLGKGQAENKQIIILVAQLAIAVLTAILFLVMARNSRVARILVTGSEILVHRAFGKPVKTAFTQIRTVKKNGGETAMASDSLVIRPNGGRRFKVAKTMKNYDRFARQIESDVALPNLTKKRITEVVEEENED